jgi:hypothetical protein
MKKIISMAFVVLFAGSVMFFVPCRGFAINPQPEPPAKINAGVAVNDSYIGTIIKIEGNHITVRNERGVDSTITGSFVGLKIGSKVKVTTRDGRTWLNPQPEPPLPAKAKPLAK